MLFLIFSRGHMAIVRLIALATNNGPFPWESKLMPPGS